MITVLAGMGVAILAMVVLGLLSLAYGARTGRWDIVPILIDASVALGNAVIAGFIFASEYPVMGAFNAGACAYYLWLAWDKWRRRKDRKPSRVLGVVRDLGHRLAVVNVASTPGGAQ